ncbi:hypothetical protein ElyMa_003272100 [Elysia marginata]|uniref:Uncharacterized protein n=1 Tax=Elysia marginata TaxID=1093978 RepID=A0AAV4JBP8_9GAST|nr:hypothetical protein ElyMa_003272100 [Elysia marginata]
MDYSYIFNALDYLPLSCETRTRGHCYIKPARYDVRKNFLDLRVTNAWNSLQQSSVTASSLNDFKDGIDGLLRDYKYITTSHCIQYFNPRKVVGIENLKIMTGLEPSPMDTLVFL